MKPILYIFSACLFAAILFSCEKNEVDSSSNVNAETIIHQELYEELDKDVPLKEVKIIGDELHVTINDGGCSGARWKVKLVGGSLAYSNPPQRFAKIEFVNDEECEAWITRTFVFDLKPLRVKGSRKVNIKLEGWPKQLLYAY
ncbi:hypothetical protein SDC9_163177 [bioreactor metagenome]|uniref:Lipoprotein n=1 Tax=bioreactor metagenome TaxID=1076179 RepID=A0A645FN54_9ZZZZ|nr:hypothetical protein [Proteiniphilum sp.]MEA4917354.1 hypothetical protein [Proteiniphilum sp.]